MSQLVRDVVDDARALVLDLEQRGKFISKHYRYPRMTEFRGGLPNVQHGMGPPDWSGPFTYRGGDDYEIGFQEVARLPALVEHVLRNQRLADRILPPGGSEDAESRRRLNEISVGLPVFSLLDRLIHLHGREFGPDAFEREWAPLGRWLESDPGLPVEVVVPLAMVACDRDDDVVLSDEIRVTRLPEGEQRARVPETVWDGAAHPCVLAAATHALVFGGRRLAQLNPWTAHWEVPQVLDATPIDQTVHALQLSANTPLGYAQVYLRPLGWTWRYDADLPPIIDGRIVRRYPPMFSDYAWNRPPSTLSGDAIDATAPLLATLDAAGPRMALAVRRFGQAQLRDQEEDAVLDACIALEAALGDSQPNEMTYKVSMRCAGLLGDRHDPSHIRALVTRLYSWRSKIVHGDDATKARRRFIGDTGVTESQAKDLAVALVGLALEALLRDPVLASGKDIDSWLLARIDSRAGEHPKD